MPTATYLYPASEAITDALELAMDPYKLAREKASLATLMQFDWKNALDLGCGIGRYFYLFQQTADLTPSIKRHLFAIEPDVERRHQALITAQKLEIAGRLNITVVASAVDLPLGISFDLITCNQVLGHLTHSQCTELLTLATSLRSDVGQLIVLLPIVTTDGLEEYAPTSSFAAEDYYFSVDIRRTPFELGYATTLLKEQFEYLVINGDRNFLPVHAFNIGKIDVESRFAWPVLVHQVPTVLSAFQSSRDWVGYVYSAHRTKNDGKRLLLGDAIFRI